MEKEINHTVKWYDNARVISTLIIVVILMIVVCSQSFAVVDNSVRLFGSVINHNTSYLLVLFYFVCIKFYYGKKYFNYFNLFLIFVYLLLSITSFLTVIQSFSFNTIFIFLENIVLLIYLFHTMFRDTRVWKEFKLGESPFNEIPNDYYFIAILTIITFTLITNLISTVVISGLVISLLDAIYVVLFSRYIYLYRIYLDKNKLDISNNGNFDAIKDTIAQDFIEIKKSLNNTKDIVIDKVNELNEEYDIDNKIDNIKESLKNTGDAVKSKASELVDLIDIDDNLNDINYTKNKDEKKFDSKKELKDVKKKQASKIKKQNKKGEN